VGETKRQGGEVRQIGYVLALGETLGSEVNQIERIAA